MLISPPLAISASGEHQSFPGTLSLGAAVFEQVVMELVRSADWSAGVVLINGHGGNREPVYNAVRNLQTEQRRVLAWWPKVEGGEYLGRLYEESKQRPLYLVDCWQPATGVSSPQHSNPSGASHAHGAATAGNEVG